VTAPRPMAAMILKEGDVLRRGTLLIKEVELQRRIKHAIAFRAVELTRSDYASVGL
jgi:hypothetical protein